MEKPKGPTMQVSVRLGHWETGHKFNIVEYFEYKKEKRDLLDSSIGRVVAMEGGIVWRLSKDIVKQRSAIQGPSQLAKSQGTMIRSLGRYYLVDDGLQPANKDIICGVYHVLKGISHLFLLVSHVLNIPQ